MQRIFLPMCVYILYVLSVFFAYKFQLVGFEKLARKNFLHKSFVYFSNKYIGKTKHSNCSKTTA